MNNEDIKKLAELHWLYTAKIMELAGHQPTEIEHYLYTQAMVHGYKHSDSDNGITKPKFISDGTEEKLDHNQYELHVDAKIVLDNIVNHYPILKIDFVNIQERLDKIEWNPNTRIIIDIKQHNNNRLFGFPLEFRVKDK